MKPPPVDSDDHYTGEFTLYWARHARERGIERAHAEWLEPLEDAGEVDAHADVIAACKAAYAAAVQVADARYAATEAAVHARVVYQRVSESAP